MVNKIDSITFSDKYEIDELMEVLEGYRDNHPDGRCVETVQTLYELLERIRKIRETVSHFFILRTTSVY